MYYLYIECVFMENLVFASRLVESQIHTIIYSVLTICQYLAKNNYNFDIENWGVFMNAISH